MRTANDINTEVMDLRGIIASEATTAVQARRAKKKIEYLNQCLLYLSTDPSETFIKREINRISNQIETAYASIESWLSSQKIAVKKLPEEKRKRLFEKEAGIPKLRKHLKNLKFLLGKK